MKLEISFLRIQHLERHNNWMAIDMGCHVIWLRLIQVVV